MHGNASAYRSKALGPFGTGLWAHFVVDGKQTQILRKNMPLTVAPSLQLTRFPFSGCGNMFFLKLKTGMNTQTNNITTVFY